MWTLGFPCITSNNMRWRIASDVSQSFGGAIVTTPFISLVSHLTIVLPVVAGVVPGVVPSARVFVMRGWRRRGTEVGVMSRRWSAWRLWIPVSTR